VKVDRDTLVAINQSAAAAEEAVAAGYSPIGHSHDHGALTGLADDDHPQYPQASATETITGSWTFEAAPMTSMATPQLMFKETSAAADEQRWRIVCSGADFYIQSATDTHSSFSNVFRAERGSGTAIAQITYGNTTDYPLHVVSGPMSVSTVASHITMYETDGAAPTDRGLVEVNSNELNLYGHDASAATWRRFFGGNITTGGVVLGNAAGAIGFYASAGTTKPTISGARGGNVALTNLLTALANLGLITNSTTA
jgi:hypothetical protein